MVQGILGERSIKVVGGGGLGSKLTFFSSLRYFDILHMADQMLFTESKIFIRSQDIYFQSGHDFRYFQEK